MARLDRAALVERPARSHDTERVIRLTEAGRLTAWGGRNPVTCWRRPWNGSWRLVLFDVQESKRSDRIKLQRQLRRLWFGYLQDSVWISPDPADALRRALGGLAVDAATLTLMEARPCSGETDADLVAGAWDFGRINRHYDDYLEILRSLSAASGVRARRSWLQVEWKAWCRAVQSDPLLPEALLPRFYRGCEAWERRQERMQRLLDLD
ncbi:MAG: PaaX family transcriptional regulator C-terminal domain-containing protein [Opitutaceae bacterium]|nr:PaaX family transcriptional regulator C-terminal domain-containing protein [Opitutaceae bacterium]